VAVAEALVSLLGGAAVSRVAISTGTVNWEIEAAVRPAAGAAPVSGATPGRAEVPAAATGGAPAGHDVTSPLVGVFYRAQSPGTPPFVEPGDHVSIGQQIAIVEAMKMMNEVVADRAGTVRRIHPPDGSVVEFGQALITLEVER
jgi:acetyl-CoA carboxylase biotin carboxyl carrier protein